MILSGPSSPASSPLSPTGSDRYAVNQAIFDLTRHPDVRFSTAVAAAD
jgi:hypothetical protein